MKSLIILNLDDGVSYHADIQSGIIQIHRIIDEQSSEVWQQQFDTRNANFGQLLQLGLDRLLDAVRDDIQKEEKALQERRRALDMGRK